MACQFCATGQAGFRRNLSVGEIVEQVVAAAREARPRRLSNVVFMGMGEPLANYDRTWGAVRRLHGDMGLSARHLTISTVGVVPGIKRLAGETLPVNLAVSLHAANDTLRATLVPLGRRYPLEELARACEHYVRTTRRRLSLEWALIDGVNDRPSDALELSRFAHPLSAHVNLIPLNPTPGYPVKGTPAQRVARFRSELESLGINATIRVTRGAHIDAACGQLAASASSCGGSVCDCSRTPRLATNVAMARAPAFSGHAPFGVLVPPPRRRHRHPRQAGPRPRRLPEGGRDQWRGRCRRAVLQSMLARHRGHPCRRGPRRRAPGSPPGPAGPGLAPADIHRRLPVAPRVAQERPQSQATEGARLPSTRRRPQVRSAVFPVRGALLGEGERPLLGVLAAEDLPRDLRLDPVGLLHVGGQRRATPTPWSCGRRRGRWP